jgi:methyl-accepting chemotaxis protein
MKNAHKNVHTMIQDVADLYVGNYANGQIFAATSSVEKNMNIVFDKLNKIKKLNCEKIQ